MKTKRKMIIAISALAMVILAGVVAVVAVLAASSVTVNSTLKIKYTVADVEATVEVYAAKVAEDEDSIDWGTAKKAVFGIDGLITGSSSGLTSPVANANNASCGFDFSSDFSKTDCVVMKFVIKNDGAKAFSAKLDDINPGTIPVALNYKVSTTAINDATAISGPYSHIESIAAGSTSTMYVKITLTDKTGDVTFEPSFDWVLEKI